MILINTGQGSSLVLFDANKNYDSVLVKTTSADVYWHYSDEPASAARFLSTVPLDTEVVVALSTEVDRDITIRAIPRTAYSRSSAEQDLTDAEQVTAESDRLAKAVLGLTVKAGKRFVRISVDNWNRFSRVRKVDVTTDETFTDYTTYYFDLDQRKESGGDEGAEAEFNELPDYVDIERLPPDYPASISWATDVYYVRVSHSVQSSARASGSTYEEKVASLRYSEVSDVLEITFEGDDPGSEGGGVVGLPDPFPYPADSGSGLVDDIRVSGDEYYLATPYRHGLISADLPYGQYLGGRKVWTGQQIFASGGGAIDDWTRDGGNLGPTKTSGLRTAPTLPTDSSLIYHADVSGDHVQIASHGVWRHDTTPDPARYHFYRSTHDAGVTDDPPFFDSALTLGRIAPAVWTDAAWRYSGRIDFALEEAIEAESDVVPVSVDIYGGRASSDTTDATGTRGLRIDSRGNAILGVGSLAVDSVGGYAYLPQFVGTPTTSAPVSTPTGYVALAMEGTTLKAWSGSAWIGVSGANPAGSGSELQYRSSATAFGAVTDSSVSGANLTLGGSLTLNTANSQAVFSGTTFDHTLRIFDDAFGGQLRLGRARGSRSSPSNISNDDTLGIIDFEGRVGGSFVRYGRIFASYNSGGSALHLIPDTSGGTVRIWGTTLTIDGTIAFTDDLRQTFNPGTTNAGLNVGSLAGNPSSLSNGDLWYNSSGNVLNARINGATVSLGSGTPSGSGTELQYRSGAASFGAVSSSSVSGGAITLGDSLTLKADTTITAYVKSFGSGVPVLYLYRNAGIEASPAALASGDILGRIYFGGSLDATTTVGNVQIGATITAEASATWDASNSPTDIVVRTKSSSGSSAGTVAARFTSDRRLGVGSGIAHSDITYTLTVSGSGRFYGDNTETLFSSTTQDAYFYQFDDGFGGQFNILRARGTRSSPSNISNDDTLGIIDFFGRVGGSYVRYSRIFSSYNSGGSSLHLIPDTSGGTVRIWGATLVIDGTFSLTDDVRQTFNPGTTNAGLNVGSLAGNPSSLSNGDLWYNSSGNVLNARINGATVSLGAGGGYATIQEEGSGLTARATLNFIGNVATAADDSGNSRTNVTINAVTGTSGSGSELQYRTGAYTLGAVTSSSVSGADVTWAGVQVQTLTNTVTSGTVSYYEQNISIGAASNSTAEHRLSDVGVVWSTAVNTGSVRLRFADITHGQSGTVSSFYGDHLTYYNTAGTTTTVTGHTFTYNDQAGTTSQAIGYVSNLNATGGTLTSGIGYYATFDRSSGTLTSVTGFQMFVSGTIGTVYGVIMPSGSLSGFGITSPLYPLDAYISAGDVARFAVGTTSRLVISETASTFTIASNDTVPYQFNFTKYRGTDVASPSAVQDADDIGRLTFRCYDGGAIRSPGRIQFTMDGTVGSGDVPVRAEIWTAQDGTTSAVKAFVIDRDQRPHIKVVSSAPSDTPADRSGAVTLAPMELYSSGGVYRLYVYLNGGWRNVALT